MAMPGMLLVTTVQTSAPPGSVPRPMPVLATDMTGVHPMAVSIVSVHLQARGRRGLRATRGMQGLRIASARSATTAVVIPTGSVVRIHPNAAAMENSVPVAPRTGMPRGERDVRVLIVHAPSVAPIPSVLRQIAMPLRVAMPKGTNSAEQLPSARRLGL